jgi:hypothetical protein
MKIKIRIKNKIKIKDGSRRRTEQSLLPLDSPPHPGIPGLLGRAAPQTSEHADRHL